jgi:hypothetical protein
MKLRHPIVLLAIPLLAGAMAAGAQSLYKWVDDKGKVTYSDQPPPTANVKSQEQVRVVTPINTNAFKDMAKQDTAFKKRQEERRRKRPRPTRRRRPRRRRPTAACARAATCARSATTSDRADDGERRARADGRDDARQRGTPDRELPRGELHQSRLSSRRSRFTTDC